MTTYIIAGVPRSGKSTVRRKLLKDHRISGFSTDLIREALIRGIPEFGIKSEQDDITRAHILWPYFREILVERQNYNDDLVIEGTNFLPEHLQEFGSNTDYKLCFLGFPNIDPQEKLRQIRIAQDTDDNWTDDYTDEELLPTIEKWIRDSKQFESECERYGMQFFDTGENFSQTVAAVTQYLSSNK